jgi:hypothetical protein
MSVAVAEAAEVATGSAGTVAAEGTTARAAGTAKRAPAKRDPAPGGGAKKSAVRPGGGSGEKTPPGRADRAKAGYEKGRKGYRQAKSALPTPTFGRGSRPRQLLVMEFVTCAGILLFAPVSDKHAGDKPADWLRRSSALALLFLMLGLLATAGPKVGRLAASLGGLVTLTLLVSERDVLTQLAARVSPGGGSTPAAVGSDVGAGAAAGAGAIVGGLG